MPGIHQRTWQQFDVAHLNVTVQLDPPAEGCKVERHQELANVTRQLVATMDAERIPATWAVSDPAHSAATSLIRKSPIEHEFAILGDANWVGPTAGRTRFARELVRRLTQARAAGLEVTTLVPSVASIDDHIDLVVKHHLTAVAGLASTPAVTLEPHALHYGVWEIPVTSGLPCEGTWFRSGKRTVWRSVRQLSDEVGSGHLLIDAAAITSSEGATVTWLMHNVASLRDRGVLRIETLRATAARLSDVPAVSPQRSILRVA